MLTPRRHTLVEVEDDAPRPVSRMVATVDEDDAPRVPKPRNGNVVDFGGTPRPIPIEDPEALAARVVAADKIEPGYAQAVVDAIIEKLGDVERGRRRR